MRDECVLRSYVFKVRYDNNSIHEHVRTGPYVARRNLCTKFVQQNTQSNSVTTEPSNDNNPNAIASLELDNFSSSQLKTQPTKS